VTTCRQAAELPKKPGVCVFGCLGLGDCVTACPTGALVLSPIDTLVFDRGECISCGACVAACPREMIRMAPAGAAAADSGYLSDMRSAEEGCAICQEGE
jgi:electron transport complex protein RnfB